MTLRYHLDRIARLHVVGMSLKTGHEHVDQSGLVFLPYLHKWAAMTHNLEQLCDFMSRVFGEDPPVSFFCCNWASLSISRGVGAYGSSR